MTFGLKVYWMGPLMEAVIDTSLVDQGMELLKIYNATTKLRTPTTIPYTRLLGNHHCTSV